MAALESEVPSRSAEFETQMLLHMDALYSVALRLTHNPADAQDLLQDAVVKALRFHHRFKEGTYLKAWLLTILRNTFINDYRKRARRPAKAAWAEVERIPNMEPDRDVGYYPRELVFNNVLELLDDEIRFAVESLPESHRQTVIMADLQDMSYKEIAAVMECPLGTVMSRLHRGRKLLRKSLGGYREQVALICS